MGKWANGALATLSVIAGLGLCEVFLRLTVPLEALFSGLQGYPALATEGWERVYLRDCAESSPFDLPGHALKRFRHDPQLGWDTPNRVRGGRPFTAKKAPGTFRVITVGDSFAYGADVSERETFSHVLETLLPRGEVLNMGVNAYGIDQAALKYLLHGSRLEHDLVVFAMPDMDYQRVAMSFFRFQKPLLKVDRLTGEVAMTVAPIPGHTEVYERVRRERGPFSFLYTELESVWLNARYGLLGENPSREYFGVWDPVIEALLKKVQPASARAGAKLLILGIPGGGFFQSQESLLKYEAVDPVHTHLRQIARNLGARFVDLGEELPRKLPTKDVYDRLYLHRGRQTGHLTPEGNRVTAQILLETYQNWK